MIDDLIEGAAGAASFTGLTRRKIYRLVEQGHLPCVRKGKRLFFRKSELRKAFESSRFTNEALTREFETTISGRNVRVRIEPPKRGNRLTWSTST